MSAPYIQHSQWNAIPDPTQQLQRDLSLWFFDGNVVLVAQGVAFRVHKGVLAFHSDVFRTWFAGPAAPITTYGTVTLFEGEPVVWLRPCDTAYDLRQALHVMYGMRQLDDPAQATFSIVAGLRRFALAYGMNALAETAWRLLAPTFPSDLEEWDFHAKRRLPFDLGEYQAIEAFNLLKFRDEGGYVAAVYLCAQLPLEVICRGARRADGMWEVLSEGDIRVIIKAKAQLQQLSAKVLTECTETKFTNGHECHETGCEDAFYVLRFPEGPGAQRLAHGDAISKWPLDCIDGLERDNRICEYCAEDARERFEGLREQVWKEFVESVEVPGEVRFV